MLPSPNSLHHVTEQAESEESETKPDKKKLEVFEWDEIKATNHPEYKIWLRRRETLLLEHQKQIQLGYIRLFTNEEKHAKKKKIKRELFEQEDLQTNFRGIQKTPTKNSLEQSRNDFVAPGPFFTKMEVSEGSSEETMDYRRKCEAFLDSLTGVRALSPNFTTNHDHTYCKLHNNSSGAHRTYFNVTSGLPRPGHNGSTYSMLHNSMPGSYRSHLNLISSLPQHNDRTYRMLHNSMSGARGTHFHLKISSLPLPKPNMEPPTLHIMLESNTSNMLGETVHIMIDLPEPTKINGSSQLLNNAPVKESRPICPDEKVAQALPTEVKSNFLQELSSNRSMHGNASTSNAGSNK